MPRWRTWSDAKISGGDYEKVVKDAKKKRRSADATLAHMSAALAAVLVFKNMHCSGVTANATLEEYNSTTIVDGCKVINVKKHKISRQGAAKLVTEGMSPHSVH